MIDYALVQKRWPSQYPDRLQLYSINSPNGIKVACMLEETGLPYEPHTVNLFEGEQHDDAFAAISPNAKIPILVDPAGSDGGALRIMESGAILMYLADKAGSLIPVEPSARIECLQWLFFQVGHIGPMFGQYEHFHRRGDDNLRDPYALQRYEVESMRLMGVLNARLTDTAYIAGENYTIADIAIFPWLRSLARMIEMGTFSGNFPNAMRWFTACMERPATQAGITVCAVQR